jgi:gluconokinase
MPPALLDSQFATLEEPGPDEEPFVVSIAKRPGQIVDEVVALLTRSPSMALSSPRASPGGSP